MAEVANVLQWLIGQSTSQPDQIALRIKRDGQYQPISWSHLKRDVCRAAAVLAKAGVEPGERVVQWSPNTYLWIVCDLAIGAARAVHVPLHAPLTGEQAVEQIEHCRPNVAIVDGAEQAKKLESLASALSKPIHWLGFESHPLTVAGKTAQPMFELMANADDAQGDEMLSQAAQELSHDSLATILYTSGTTGEPKGVMLTQGNLVSNAWGAISAFGVRQNDLRLTFLPLSHIYARTCDLYTWLATGMQLALAESRESVLADCAAVHPTLINGVPYFFDKVRRYVCEQGFDQQPDGLRRVLGGAIRICNSGGAALPDHVYDFYWQHDVPLTQGYGLTETSPVITLNTQERHRRGSAGLPIAGVEVRIAADGEILTRGPHVMAGYYRAPEATAETIRDGWLHTGDLGRVDEDGFLYITGRKKEILVTSGGKNVAPAPLESLLTEDPLIEQALVVGDGRNYLSALIVPNPDALKQEILSRKMPVSSREAALSHPQVLALYEERIGRRLAQVSHYEQVRRFTLLDRGFTIEQGEMTPKLSLRRSIIEDHFADAIEAMYQ